MVFLRFSYLNQQGTIIPYLLALCPGDPHGPPGLQRDLPIFRQRLVREEAAKVGLKRGGIRREVYEFTQGRVGEGELQVI